MKTLTLQRLVMTLLVSQALIACKAPSSDSSSGSDNSSNSGQSGGVVTTPSPSPSVTPSPTPSTGGTSDGNVSGGYTGTPNGSTTGSANSNCGTAQVGTLDPGVISINGGAAVTNNLQVSLKLDKLFMAQMKVSNTADCSCGTWEAVANSKSWILATANANNAVSVQFKDYDGGLTVCASASILHDNMPPAISLTAASGNSYTTGSNNNFNYAVTDAGVGVKSVACSLDGQGIACSGNSGVLSLGNLSAGTHKVIVSATDKLDQASQAFLNFTITAPYREISQNKAITAENEVDILVVVDNSPSMEDVQKSMAKRISSLMAYLQYLDYRIAVTTTDPTNQTWGDGNLVQITGFPGQYIITPAMGLANAQTALSNTVQRPEIGSPSEQGIYATYRVIERAMAGFGPQKDFFRAGAAFSVVLISDQDESDIGKKNQPSNLIQLVKSNFPNKKFTFNSIIVKPGDSACLRSGREGYGTSYDALSKLLGYGTVGGSIIGTVCASDYGTQLSGVGESVSQMIKTMDLECSPLGSSTSAVTVLKDGSAYTDAYSIQGLKIVFQNNLPAGNYTLMYKCQ